MRTSVSRYHRHRFPAEIISHCVWLYFRFALSFGDASPSLGTIFFLRNHIGEVTEDVISSCIPIQAGVCSYGYTRGERSVPNKTEVWQGTLALMILKTLESLGPLHGYGIARRIEQTSGDLIALNYGTLYPSLLKLEQEGSITSEWGFSENNRKAKYYTLTRAGRRQLAHEEKEWNQTTAIIARFLKPAED
jgi:transcriptional regulator